MSSPLTKQYKDEITLFEKYVQEVGSEYVAAKNKGDTARAEEALGLLDKLDKERPRIDQKYQELQSTRVSDLLKGISSGDLITDKKVTKIAVPNIDIAGFGGAMASGEDTVTERIDKRFNPKKAKTALAEVFEVDPERVDVESGLGAGATTALGGLQDPDAQEAYLKQKFPTVLRMVIDGKPNFVVEDRTDTKLKTDKGKFKVVFPKGIQGADVAAFAATETAPIIVGLLGGIGGAAVGSPSGPGAIAASAAGANLGYSGTGALQDTIYRGALGIPLDLSEIASRRGKEAALGMTIDVATAGTASKLGLSRAGKGIENEVEKNLRESVELLRKEGMDVNYPIGAAGGTKGLLYEQALGGAFPKMQVGLELEKNRKVFADFQKSFVEGRPVTNKSEVVEILKKEVDNVATRLAGRKSSLEIQPKRWAERRIAQLMPDETSMAEAGKNVSQILTKGREFTRQAKNAEFDAWAKSTTATQTPEELANVLRPIVQDSGLGKNPAVEEIMTRLGNAEFDRKAAQELESEIMRADAAGILVPEQARIKLKNLREYSEPFDAIRSRDLIKNLQADIPNTPIGWNKNNDVTRKATEAIRDNFQSKLNSQELAGWDKFKDAYTDYLSFEKGQIGKMVEDNFGDLKIAPEKIIKNAISDTKAANDIFNAVKAAGDVEGEAYLRDTLQKAYLEKIGLSSQKGFKVGKTNFDDGMVDALWGKTLGGERVKKTLKEVNQSLELAKVDYATIDPAAAARLLEPISDKEKQTLIKTIVQTADLQAKEDAFMRNEMIKSIKDGKLDVADNVAFGSELAKARTTDVIEIAARLPLQKRKEVGADMIAAIMQDYAPKAGANQTRHGIDLWDGEKFIKELGGWKRGMPNAPKTIRNLDAITGSPKLADQIIAASRVQAANRPIGKEEALELRLLVSGTGGKVYTEAAYFGHKLIAAAYGANMLEPFLRRMSKDIGDEAYQQNVQRMMKGLATTRVGINAAAQQAKNDPDFSNQFQTIMAEIEAQNKEEQQNER